MSDGRVVVSGVGEGATLEVPRGLQGTWKHGLVLQALPFGADAALFVRASPPSSGFFAASLSSFGIDEAFGLIIAGVRTGRLSFTRGSVRKTITFRDGQVVFASSTESWERLGAALLSLRVLTRDELTAALAEVGPTARLGQVLTRSGKLSQSRLYAAMTQLAKDIVLNLLSEEGEGQLLFLEGVATTEDVLKLPQSTRELVFAGMKRREEVMRLRRVHPPERRLSRGRDPGPGPGRTFVERVGEGATISALRATFEGTDHAFFTRVDDLVKSGALIVAAAASEAGRPSGVEAAAATLPVVERYCALVKSICEALLAAGVGLGDLRSFLSDPLPGMEEGLNGVTLSEEGVLDAARLVANLGGDSAMDRAKTYELLDSLVSYALFSARNVLPQEVAEKLSAEARGLQEGAT